MSQRPLRTHSRRTGYIGRLVPSALLHDSPLHLHPHHVVHLCGQTCLGRQDVVGTPLAKYAFDVVDVIWLHDHRIVEITGG